MFSLKLFRMHPSISFGIVRKSFANIPLEVLSIRNHRQITTHKSSIFDREILTSFQTYRFMAGHSKWQNVKHVKAEKDKQKSLLYSKYVRKVYAAVRERGPDPKTNNKLAQIFEMARKDNVPSSTLENATKKSSSKKFESGIIEMLGPGGCMVVLEYETDCISEMRRTIKQLCRRYTVGIYPGGGGRWRSAYEQKGIVKVTNQLNGEPFDAEKMLDFAIEAGAEDVQKTEEDSNIFYEFFCAPDDLNFVKKELEKTFTIDEAFVAYLPISTAVLSDADKSIAMDFLNELGDLPDVSRLYENIE